MELRLLNSSFVEVDHAKDQVMTALKLALVNLVMWVRQQYFSAAFAQATWHRLVPFFRLPGWVIWRTDTGEGALRPFNDRQLNQDLAAVCVRVSATLPRLPDGTLLQLTLDSRDALVWR